MKIEKLLLGLFASFLMVGCSQNDDAPNASEEAKGKDKDSYLCINIKSTYDMSSRTSNTDFEEGTDGANGTNNENSVSKIHFFFFDALGNPFDVSGDRPVAITEGFGNYVIVSQDIDTEVESDNAHIEKFVKAIVVIHTPNHNYPASVVAVLNWDYSAQVSLTLSALKDNLATSLYAENEGVKSNFLMSNSVYVNSGLKEATPLETKHFAPTDQLAINNPVEVYVERLAAKVQVDIEKEGNADYKSFGTTHALKVNGTTLQTSLTDNNVYAKILGWDLNTTISQSYLLKHVEESWETTPPFSNWTDWNEAVKHRSYWGIGAHGAAGTQYSKEFKWTTIANTFPSIEYCMENTNTASATNVLVKAQLVDADGNNISVAQFLGQYYYEDKTPDTENSPIDNWATLRTAVADALQGKMLTGNNKDVNITPSDIKLVAGHTKYPNEASAYYKVYFELSSTGSAKTWYKSDGTQFSDATAVNTEMNNLLIPAKMWYDGATYYFTPISHFGYQNAVIRNHYYKVQITKVQGLGTPVNDTEIDDTEEPTPPFIPEPVDPSDSESFIAAKINVLSWRLNEYDVTLGQ